MVSRSFLALLLTGAAVAGYEPTLSPQAIGDAVALGQSRIESVRLRFHQPYRIEVGRPPVDYIDVVTPFRRVELAAEERLHLGERGFGQREALAVLAEHGDQVKLFVEFTFHPLNTYVGVPAYVVTLVPLELPVRIDPVDTQRIPRFGARMERIPLPYPPAPVLPSGSQPMLGGTLIVSFGGRQLTPRGMYDVVIEEAGKELARAGLDLGKLR